MSLYVDIKKKFDDFALDVKFQVDNQVLGILGASGCGKSMTLKCIAGIVKPDEGKIILNDRVLFDSQKGINLPPQQRKTGFLFQNYALFPNMSVKQNIKMGARHGAGKVDEIIKKMYLEGLENHMPGELSGGQKQRTALARILVGEPEILMLDEPFSALDGYLRWNVELEIADIIKNYAKTTLFVSHSRDEIYRMCSRACVIHEGKSSKVKSVTELFEKPDTKAACMISGCKNYSLVEIKGPDTVYASDWGITLKCRGPIQREVSCIGVRSHYITPVNKDDEKQDNVFECTVVRVIENIFSMVVMVKTPGEGLLRLEMDKEKWNNELRAGDSLKLAVRPDDIILLKNS